MVERRITVLGKYLVAGATLAIMVLFGLLGFAYHGLYPGGPWQTLMFTTLATWLLVSGAGAAMLLSTELEKWWRRRGD